VSTRRTPPRTWWGGAWVEALETRAELDPNRLSRGLHYARTGAVRRLDLRAGSVTATVQGSRLMPYDVVVRVPTFTDEQWGRVLDVVAAQASHTAALLDGELPPELVADVAAAGLDLLPGAGELRPECSCPDDVELCKHSAATCYVVAEALDRDPFELLQLRGLDRVDVLNGLRARRGGGEAPVEVDAEVDDGVDAVAAFARTPGPLPQPPLPPARPGRPAPLASEPPPGGVRAGDLSALASDAAARAWEMLAVGGDGALSLTPEQDLARRAVALLGTKGLDALAKRAAVSPNLLSRRAVAWQHGGAGALAVMDEEWTPDYPDLAEGVAALGSGGDVSRNRVSDSADVRQLRLGRDGLWYPMRRVRAAWEVVGPPSADPRDAAALL
jgi:uncharacterized Zn finger protein